MSLLKALGTVLLSCVVAAIIIFLAYLSNATIDHFNGTLKIFITIVVLVLWILVLTCLTYLASN